MNAHVLHPNQLGLIMDQADLSHISDGLTFRIFPLIYHFGQAWHYITGFMMLWVVFKIFLGSVWRAWIIYQQRGCGIWLIAALWHTATTMVMTPLIIAKEAGRRLLHPPDQPESWEPYRDLRDQVDHLRRQLDDQMLDGQNRQQDHLRNQDVGRALDGDDEGVPLRPLRSSRHVRRHSDGSQY